MKTVPLHGKVAAGRVALIDDEDFDLVMQYRWVAVEHSQGRRTAGPYAVTYIGGGSKRSRTAKRMHSLITGWPLVDHRDHDGLNNQRLNLRPATAMQNSHNLRPHLGSSSRFKGVTWVKRRHYWQASIRANSKSFYLGRFAREEDAALAYNAAAAELFGEFAYLNEIPETA